MAQRQRSKDAVEKLPVTIDPQNPEAGRGGGVPPAATRWKPGESGNPNGRPKGAATRYQHERDKLKARRESVPTEVRGTVIPAPPGWWVVGIANYCEGDPKDGGERSWRQIVAYPVAAWILTAGSPSMWDSDYAADLKPLINDGVCEQFDHLHEADLSFEEGKLWVVHESQVDPAWLREHVKPYWSFEEMVEAAASRL